MLNINAGYGQKQHMVFSPLVGADVVGGGEVTPPTRSLYPKNMLCTKHYEGFATPPPHADPLFCRFEKHIYLHNLTRFPHHSHKNRSHMIRLCERFMRMHNTE